MYNRKALAKLKYSVPIKGHCSDGFPSNPEPHFGEASGPYCHKNKYVFYRYFVERFMDLM